MASLSAFSSLSSKPTNLKPHGPTLRPCPNFLKPNLTLKFPRLWVSHSKRKASNNVFPTVISCLVDDNSEACPELNESSVSNCSNPGATINLKLPRRSLLVHFTCNACGERSQKRINRLAYEKGTVFVQCSGCLQHHKLVDNLNLVVEYDLREEIDMRSDADQS